MAYWSGGSVVTWQLICCEDSFEHPLSVCSNPIELVMEVAVYCLPMIVLFLNHLTVSTFNGYEMLSSLPIRAESVDEVNPAM